MRLVKPHSQYEQSFRAAFDEMLSDSDRDAWIYLGPDIGDYFKISFQEYVDRLIRFETDPPSHFVRGTTYWAVEGDEVIGRIGLRHELNDFLRKAGGHIGYIVRPSWRRRGIATKMVKDVLKTKRAQSIGRLLVTCDEGNLASEKTIVKNGGQLQDFITYEPNRPSKKRYWIHLNDSPIRMLQEQDALAYASHLARTFASSGTTGTPIFTVFPNREKIDVTEIAERAREKWQLSHGAHGWERSWGYFDGNSIIGEVTLLTSRLTESQLHRAILGMGIEPGYRNCGLGKALLTSALDWAKSQNFLEWIDLGVFSHNAPARTLYQQFGFIETGRIVDCFRVDDYRIDDIQMTLNLRDYSSSGRTL